ncbi:MAG: glycosyltransferase family 4 protein [Deltaproteobacteria bacterium]|nr:glycosyltransferase family 4 protein [Deltaproteobacteria bacterium]
MTPSVAHVTTIADSLELLLLDQLRAIRGAGYTVTGLSAAGPATAVLARAGIPHLAVPFVRASGLTPLADLRALGHLVRTFRRERFAVVHTHTAKPDLYAAIAARAAGVPIVVTTLHGFYFHDDMPRRTRRLFVHLARAGMACCDAVLSQNPEDIDTAIRERICPPSKIALLGNGIDVERFDRARIPAATTADLRRELGIPPGAPVVGFVGRLVAEKGVPELLAAAAAVRARVPDVRFLFVGWHDRAKQDAIDPSAAARHGIADRCVFTGHRRDIPELMSAMDLFVLPSHREGFPRTVMEASAMGLPVIATRIRGCRTAVDDGETGVLVPPRDPGALATAIAEILGAPDRARAMGRAGRRLATARFDQRTVFATVLATYERLLRARADRMQRR